MGGRNYRSSFSKGGKGAGGGGGGASGRFGGKQEGGRSPWGGSGGSKGADKRPEFRLSREEIDASDLVFGYERFTAGEPREGWLITFAQVVHAFVVLC